MKQRLGPSPTVGRHSMITGSLLTAPPSSPRVACRVCPAGFRSCGIRRAAAVRHPSAGQSLRPVVSRLPYQEEIGDLTRVSRNTAILRRSPEIADPTCKGIPRASRRLPFGSPTQLLTISASEVDAARRQSKSLRVAEVRSCHERFAPLTKRRCGERSSRRSSQPTYPTARSTGRCRRRISVKGRFASLVSPRVVSVARYSRGRRQLSTAAVSGSSVRAAACKAHWNQPNRICLRIKGLLRVRVRIPPSPASFFPRV